MSVIFNLNFIRNNELLFYTYIFFMLLIIIISTIFVFKETKKWVYMNYLL